MVSGGIDHDGLASTEWCGARNALGFIAHQKITPVRITKQHKMKGETSFVCRETGMTMLSWALPHKQHHRAGTANKQRAAGAVVDAFPKNDWSQLHRGDFVIGNKEM
jgi:hypothetical protein